MILIKCSHIRDHSMDTTSSPASRSSQSINWRGIGYFLALCLSLTWGIEIVALLHGIRFAVLSQATSCLLALVMWIPAASAFVVRRWLTGEGFASAGLRVGPWKPYLFVWLGIPCLFLVIYALTFALKLGVFNTDPVIALKSLYPLPPGKHIPPAPTLLTLLGFATFVAAPFINLIATFGEEFGWTGYLLPTLLPLGRWKAVAIYGTIWGLWHAPLIIGGFNYPGHPFAGIVWMCAFTTAIGMIQCSLLMRYRSIPLTSFLHATVNANAYGIWRLLVIGIPTFLGGLLGLVGILMIGIVGIWLMVRTKEKPFVS